MLEINKNWKENHSSLENVQNIEKPLNLDCITFRNSYLLDVTNSEKNHQTFYLIYYFLEFPKVDF